MSLPAILLQPAFGNSTESLAASSANAVQAQVSAMTE